MLYIDYFKCRNKYYEAQKKYDEVLSEKEQLFSMIYPKAVNFDKERVKGGKATNSFDKYLIKKEEKKIDERLEEAKSILKDRKHLLEVKEAELRSSNNIQDKIYCCKYLDKMKIYQIKKIVSYEDAQIYRILRQIKKNIR